MTYSKHSKRGKISLLSSEMAVHLADRMASKVYTILGSSVIPPESAIREAKAAMQSNREVEDAFPYLSAICWHAFKYSSAVGMIWR